MVNDLWLQHFIGAETMYECNSIFYHSCAIISIGPAHRLKNSFKFCDMWIKHPQFFEIVQQAWQTRVTGTTMFILVKKLQAVKARLKELHRSYYSDLGNRIADVKQQLDQCQEAIEHNRRNPTLHAQEKRLREQYMILLSAESSLAKQQAKMAWLTLGDRNTAFYHAKIKQRRARSQINSINSPTGERVTDSQNVQTIFLNYYRGLLGTSSEHLTRLDLSIMQYGSILSNEQQEALIASVESWEIKEALFSIHNGKAPPDGFFAGFFKATWHIIHEEFTAAVTDFFSSGKLLKQINATNLCLLPKVPSPGSPSDFRPIACCNVIYKTITKLMTSRLQAILPSIISPNQGAFVKGRLIVSNILVC